MMITPPVAAAQAGQSAGGGFLDSIKGMIGGGTAATPGQVDPGPKGDGSVGLFDGVLKKALLGGAAGVAMGFIPFLPGGPVLGGIVGALGGAAMGVASNWMKQKQIKQENEAMLAAMGVQVQDPNIQQVLQSGNVSQLIPMMQSGTQQAVGQATTQTPVTQSGSDVTDAEILAHQQRAIAEGKTPGPSTLQSPVPTQGSVAVGSGASGAINPAGAVNPGIAPANLSAQGGGGSAGDVGRPAAPAGTESADVSAIAPTQAGVGDAAAAGAAEGAQAVVQPGDTLEMAQIRLMIQDLQKQIDLLKEMIANDERRQAEALASEASQTARAA
jgi:hypothetical protein